MRRYLLRLILMIVFCRETSVAAMTSKTYILQTNSTSGSRLCSVNQSTTVLTLEVEITPVQCGTQCTASPCCQFYQYKENAAQCELFNDMPSQLTTINGCVSYAVLPSQYLGVSGYQMSIFSGPYFIVDRPILLRVCSSQEDKARKMSKIDRSLSAKSLCGKCMEEKQVCQWLLPLPRTD